MKKIIILSIIILILPILVYASPPTMGGGQTGTGQTGSVKLDPPIQNADNPNLIIGKVINGILGVVGSLALLMFVYGGLLWMTAAGNNERVQKGKEVLIWSTIGLVVIFSAYAIVALVFDTLGVRG